MIIIEIFPDNIEKFKSIPSIYTSITKNISKNPKIAKIIVILKLDS